MRSPRSDIAAEPPKGEHFRQLRENRNKVSKVWGRKTEIKEESVDPIILGIAVGISKRALANGSRMQQMMRYIEKELNEKLIGSWRCENGIGFIDQPDRSKKQYIYLKVETYFFFIYEATEKADTNHQNRK